MPAGAASSSLFAAPVTVDVAYDTVVGVYAGAVTPRWISAVSAR